MTIFIDAKKQKPNWQERPWGITSPKKREVLIETILDSKLPLEERRFPEEKITFEEYKSMEHCTSFIKAHGLD